jgi:hypothetical protein
MGLLDRLKPQPRWKHPDPVVRVAGVQDLPEDEQDLLAAIARDDTDARVRRTAVSKLGNVAVLTDIVRQEGDGDVRDEAAGVLLDIALGAYEADETASLAAVDGLARLPKADAQKQLILVAKTAKRENVSRRALDALGTDDRAMGTIARRAEQAAIRMDALARLTDAGELAATALKTDYKDAALGALDRIGDEETLRTLAARARNQAAQRRARSLVRAIDDRAAAEAKAEAERAAELERRRKAQRDVCREAEALSGTTDWNDGSRRLAILEQRWDDVGAEAEGDIATRVRDALTRATSSRDRFLGERAESERLAKARTAALEARAALVARVDILHGRGIEEPLGHIRAEWEALPPVPGGDPALAARFEAACRTASARAREAAMQQQTIERLEALCTELETLVGDPAQAERSPREQVARLRHEWQQALAAAPADEHTAALLARWSAADAQAPPAEDDVAPPPKPAEPRDAVGTAERSAIALERLATIPEATLKALDRALREARLALEGLEHAPGTPEREAVRARVEQALTPIVTRAQELREADDWQRWANAGMQEQLIAKMEALASVEDASNAARQLRDLQHEWQKVAAGPREQGQALWRRFKTAQDAVRAKTDAWFSEQSKLRTEHLSRKLVLCERAEALADSTDWIATADAIKALQAEWKTIGPGPRKEEQAAWERFRSVCDRFFTRRHQDLAQRKQAWAENLTRKEGLCGQAEALASSTDWEPAAAELRRLQGEWKTIGPVKKNRSEAIWQRFRAACDAFFERYKQRHSIDIASRVASREALVTEAEALAAGVTPPDEPLPAQPELLAHLRQLRASWAQAPAVPREAGVALAQRFERTLATVITANPATFAGTEFDVPSNLRRLHDLVSRAERLAGPAPASREAVSPAALLATQLREALAANTIGGRVDDEARWRSAEQELRQLQASWTQVGFVPDADLRPLTSRFQRAWQRFYDQRDQKKRPLVGKN